MTEFNPDDLTNRDIDTQFDEDNSRRAMPAFEEAPKPEPIIEDVPAATEEDVVKPAEPAPAYRATTSDPLFGFVLAAAVSIGLTPLPTEQFMLRFTVSWMALAGVGVIAWLLGNTTRIGQEKPENLVWGVAFGLMTGFPILAFGSDLLATTVNLIFPGLSIGVLLAYLVFVMPLAESLFFRGLLQLHREFWIVGLWGAAWGIILFFPAMWADILASPAVAVVIVVVLLIINMMYSYVRQRNGLAAAWICQIVVNLLILLLPALSL